MTINIGPHHPATHGVLRLVVDLEGEVVRDLQAGDRLRPHRDRKVLRGQELLEGHPLRRADGLRLLLLPDGGLLRRGRAAGRARDPAARQVPADDLPRAQPDPLPPGLAGDDGARPRRGLDALVLLPRARQDPRPVRDGDRAADAHPLLPGRRRDRGHPARLRGEAARVRRRDAGPGRPVPGPARPQRGLPLADQGRRHRPARAPARAGRDRAAAARRRRALGPAQGLRLPRLPGDGLQDPGRHGRRQLRPLPGAGGGDGRVDADHRAGARRRCPRGRSSPTTASTCCRRARSSRPRWSR